MAERPSMLELEPELTDLGRHVAYPPTPAFAARVLQALNQRPARRRLARESLAAARLRLLWESFVPAQHRLAFALVALIALAAAILAISPEARTAVAERLGLRGVVIREVPALPTPAPAPLPGAIASPVAPSAAAASSLGARLSLGQALTLEQVRVRVTFQVPLPSILGPPDEVYLLDTPPGGQVVLAYYPRPDLPQANATGVGLLLTALQGTVPAGMFGKGIPPGTRLEEVQVNGGHGYWIEGDPHTIFLLDTRGQVRTETTRLAANVLLWEQGQLTLRLESALSKDAALAIATSVN